MSQSSVEVRNPPNSYTGNGFGDLKDPPRDWSGILRSLGPGLIIAGSIDGVSVLVSTTKTGAEAGISLLWLIVIGCVIKVFVQVELGRYTISDGLTPLAALNQVPGPRYHVNWIIWYWMLMMIASLAQLGGIVGGVGQTLAITFPITRDYVSAIQVPSNNDLKFFVEWEHDLQTGGVELAKLPEEEQRRIRRGHELIGTALREFGPGARDLLAVIRSGKEIVDPPTRDDKIWATLTGIVTAFVLFWGRYRLIQHASTVMVLLVTFITLGNVIALQFTQNWYISGSEFWNGMAFGLPPASKTMRPLATALATFGIIGVGAAELVSYPYWCLEKGYARFVGPRSEDSGWAARGRGWIRVMQYDAFVSMVIYTIATLSFYLMGAAVLYKEGRDPEGMRMVSTLSEAYVPVFGDAAHWLFLIGAFAILYSTYLVVSASHARSIIDCASLFGWIDGTSSAARHIAVRWLSFGLPLFCLGFFVAGFEPVAMILLSGIMQAMMLPMLAAAALYFRFAKTDPRLKSSALWDLMLILSSIGMLIAGTWGGYTELQKIFDMIWK